MKYGRFLVCMALALGLSGGIANDARAQGSSAPGYGSAPGGAIGNQNRRNQQDEVMAKAGLTQKLNSQVPLDASFKDENGKTVNLKTLGKDKPIVLAIVFFECRTLCSEVINESVRSLKDVPFTPGKEFNVVVLSMNPRETPALASEKKSDYMKMYARPESEKGWHFLTGEKKQIDRVANAIGFRYAYDADSDQYAHPNGITFLTPHGKVARYFLNLTYPPRDLKFGLMEASKERIGSPVDQLLLTCFHYDPTVGRYGASIMGIVRLAGGLTVFLLVAMVFSLSRREKKPLELADLEVKTKEQKANEI